MENKNKNKDLEQKIRDLKIKNEKADQARDKCNLAALVALVNIPFVWLEDVAIYKLSHLNNAININNIYDQLNVLAVPFELYSLSAAIIYLAEKKADKYDLEWRMNNEKVADYYRELQDNNERR